MACRIIGCGAYLPAHVLSNLDLEQLVDTTDEWIKSRTGIAQRHIAAEGEYVSHLALIAAENAIKNAGIAPSTIDLIIVCTTTPDNSFPSTATKLQGYLGLGNIPSFDLQAVCAGFVYGLQVADSLIKSGQYNTILLAGAEKMSSLVDWQDRSTCVLFGDGAGAVILQGDNSNSGVMDSKIYSDGSLYDILYTDSESGKIKMKGQILFKHAVEKMSASVLELLFANNLTTSDVNYFIPHQANIRIIDSMAERLNFDHNKIVKTVLRHANCSAASIPLALYEASGNFRKGDVLLFTAIGAGLTWGSALVRW